MSEGVCRVVLLNDQETPMEFEVGTLERVFKMDRDTAIERMLDRQAWERGAWSLSER